MRYRADIEGLRAVAILPILLFHAGITQLRGGFIGVDIFFVISGFLITRIIVDELDRGAFSITRFYHRRFARLLPALFAVLSLTVVAGILLYRLPDQLSALASATAASLGFASNIWFWTQVDYFSSAADTQPLIHTWSLAVEEQFYLFYPLILMLLHRRGLPTMKAVLAVLTVLSFAAAWAVGRYSPETAFYWLPTRFWELAAGGLVALGALPVISRVAVRNAIVLAGGLLVMLGLVIIRHGDAFPAPYGLLPCLGAMAALAYAQGTVGGWLLSLAPIRWIGRISYSLYLWHWPVITYYRYLYGAELDYADAALLVAISIALAAVTYYTVERPSQTQMRAWKPERAVQASLAALIPLILLAVGLTRTAQAMPIPEPVRRIAEYASYAGTPEHLRQYEGGCFVSKFWERLDFARCVTPRPGQRNILVLGDSHAAQYARAIAERFPGAHVMQATASGCLPLLNDEGEPRCTEMNEQVFGRVLNQGAIDAVVLAARWRPERDRDLIRTIGYLQKGGAAVTVIGPTVEYGGDYPTLLARAMLAGDPHAVARFRNRDRDLLDAQLAEIVPETGARYYSVLQRECPDGQCRLVAPGGAPIHFDYGHVTWPAARALMRDLPRP